MPPDEATASSRGRAPTPAVLRDFRTRAGATDDLDEREALLAAVNAIEGAQAAASRPALPVS